MWRKDIRVDDLPLSRSRISSFARTRSGESSSLDRPLINSSTSEGTAPEKTSFAKAWIRCAVADSDRVFASGDVRASPYGGGGDGFVYDAE